jgi:hypothetical protein
MHPDGFNSIQKGKGMNTLITCNQFKEMEEARQNRLNRFLTGCPNRIGSGEIHSLAVDGKSIDVKSAEAKKMSEKLQNESEAFRAAVK